ncbi:MAG: FHIPEP family type III secretion protein, partial [Deltaproteobacteria bacterium]|nr:FHIPEP family type III secretion protein [Deltaproteobacteria bacterium]
MKPSLRSLPIASLGRHPDVVLAVGVAAIIAMLILPLPSMLVDGLLATNLALGAVILVAVLLSQRPLSISTFPTLLLITTLFRLALNVSTTRMILAHGTAGEVVKAFGQFVIRGDVVVGLVVFLIITLVQFLVIGKGAERVAEVGARFTLDAMPGKQMS